MLPVRRLLRTVMLSASEPQRKKVRLTVPKLALCQMQVGSDKQANLDAARAMVREAASNGANIIALPECFNCPYATSAFPEYSEPLPDPDSQESLESKNNSAPIAASTEQELPSKSKSPSFQMLSQLASECKVTLIGGSIPEVDPITNKIYNTSLTFDPQGRLIAKHRKVHLFDIDVPGKITFKESDTLSAGQSITTFDTELCKVGVAICYDIRFGELANLMGSKGAKLLVYPGAFNMTTGPAHWELLARSRAIDNQVYVAVVSIARNPASSYQAWGHSSIVSPWGEVVATCEHEPAIVYADLDLQRLEEIRGQIPVLSQKRTDIYRVAQVDG